MPQLLKELFIHADNQTMLWGILSQQPHFKILGSPPHSWFRTTIAQTYDALPPIVVQDADYFAALYEVNMNLLLDMNNELKAACGGAAAPHIPTHTPHNMFSTQQPISQNPFVNDPIMNAYKNGSAQTKRENPDDRGVFETRQKEYETMFSKHSAPEIDFAEKIDDAPIDIAALLAKQQQEREEMEQQIYNVPKMPPPDLSAFVVDTPPQAAATEQIEPPQQIIDSAENTPAIKYDIIEIDQSVTEQ